MKVRRLTSIELYRRKKAKSIFDRVWFSRKTAVLESMTMCSGSISQVKNISEA